MRHHRSDYGRLQDPAGIIPLQEPVFLLRGEDVLAPQVLEFYADLLEEAAVEPPRGLIAMVRAWAAEMLGFQMHPDGNAVAPSCPESARPTSLLYSTLPGTSERVTEVLAAAARTPLVALALRWDPEAQVIFAPGECDREEFLARVRQHARHAAGEDVEPVSCLGFVPAIPVELAMARTVEDVQHGNLIDPEAGAAEQQERETWLQLAPSDLVLPIGGPLPEATPAASGPPPLAPPVLQHESGVYFLLGDYKPNDLLTALRLHARSADGEVVEGLLCAGAIPPLEVKQADDLRAADVSRGHFGTRPNGLGVHVGESVARDSAGATPAVWWPTRAGA